MQQRYRISQQFKYNLIIITCEIRFDDYKLIFYKTKMEIENKRKKIFISNINSRLGFHLVETLRNDHEELENYTYLVGSSQKQKYPRKYHQSIHGLINYDSNPNLLARTILQCDVIILDVREATDQVQFIIKILEQKAKRQKSKSEIASNSKICLIGIGSHMTWAHEKPSINKFQSGQKQQALFKFLNYDAKKQEKITDNDRDIRLTHHSWVREREIQKSIINLSKFSNIYSCILTTGLIYGKDFPQSPLKNVMNKCFSVIQSLSIYGEGQNILPTVYIDDFCEHLQKTINFLELMEPNNKNLVCHFISVDQKLHSQLQVVERVLKSSGYTKQIIRNPLSYITKQQAFYSQSVPIMKSTAFNDKQSLSQSFCWYFDHRYDQILQYLELEWKHYVIYGQQMEAKQLQQLTQHLSTVIQVLKQQDIEKSLCLTKNISKQEVDIHEVGLIIEEQYLKKHDRQNYILVLTQILLNTEIVKKHNLIKFQYAQHAPLLLQHKYKQYSSTIQQTRSEKPSQEKNKKEILQDLVQNREIDSTVIRKQCKKIDQYLLDNVISYVAQAFVQISQKPTLTSLIGALKNIYNRQLNIAKKIGEQINEEKQNMI